MAKRMLLCWAVGLFVCVVTYGILSKSLMTKSVLKAYKAMGDKQTQLPMQRNVTQQSLTNGQLAQSRNSVLVGAVSTPTLMTRSALKAYKAFGDKQTQLPILRNATHQPSTNGQPGHTRASVLVGAVKTTPTNHTEMNPRETEKVSKLRQEMSCKLKRKVPFSTITRKQAPKDKNKDVLPEESLEKLVHFNSCAVVSSSHALRFHSYGQEIDSHDAVLRFNCAPTHKFEQFVGNRTDFRLINTKIPHVFCTEEFWSENSTMFRHGTLVVRNMNGINLERQKISTKDDKFHCFDNLIKYRKTFPKRALPFIQRPQFGNGVLAELVEFCKSTKMCDTKITPSLSSGILGVVMMMHLCDWVYVYELVPSNKDDTKLMYYFNEEKKHSWHPYNHERVYIKTLSLTPEKEVEDTGVVVLKGFSHTKC